MTLLTPQLLPTGSLQLLPTPVFPYIMQQFLQVTSSSTLKREQTSTSNIQVKNSQSIWHHVPDHRNLQSTTLWKPQNIQIPSKMSKLFTRQLPNIHGTRMTQFIQEKPHILWSSQRIQIWLFEHSCGQTRILSEDITITKGTRLKYKTWTNPQTKNHKNSHEIRLTRPHTQYKKKTGTHVFKILNTTNTICGYNCESCII